MNAAVSEMKSETEERADQQVGLCRVRHIDDDVLVENGMKQDAVVLGDEVDVESSAERPRRRGVWWLDGGRSHERRAEEHAKKELRVGALRVEQERERVAEVPDVD